jgi:ABC-type Fe3+ transport system permease subunit
MSGMDADPLSVHAAFGGLMAVLLIILLATVGLGLRAGVWGRRWRAADSEDVDDSGLHVEDTGLLDTCARTFALVLLSLIGLFALGVMYGNVLGAGAP